MAKILVVDDEQQIANALRRLLRREGFEVEVAYSGVEALERLKTFSPDIVLSDFRMPGMNGAELLQHVKHSHPLALRLIISGYADFRSVLISLNEGEICRFISKPWDDADLVAHLSRLLKERELLMQLYQPFRQSREGLSTEVFQQETGLVVKLQQAGQPFRTEQALSLIERFTGLLADESVKLVGGLLERHRGKVYFMAEVGGVQQLRVELPIQADAPCAHPNPREDA